MRASAAIALVLLLPSLVATVTLIVRHVFGLSEIGAEGR
jgi:hypothetical protein